MGRWKADPGVQLGTTATGPMKVRGYKVSDNTTLGEREAIRGDLAIQERHLRRKAERPTCPQCSTYVDVLPTQESPCRHCGGPSEGKRGRL